MDTAPQTLPEARKAELLHRPRRGSFGILRRLP